VSMRSRASERGISLIETLVMLAVTSLVASIVLPLVARQWHASTILAARSIDLVERAGAERAFRQIVRAALVSEDGSAFVRGDGSALQLQVVADQSTVCGAGPGVVRVTLQIERRAGMAKLICLTGAKRTELAEWRGADVGLSYSRDAVTWGAGWPPAAPGETPSPVLVKLAWNDGAWVEQSPVAVIASGDEL
jgi:type II secretory pathway pseudopilin PulG